MEKVNIDDFIKDGLEKEAEDIQKKVDSMPADMGMSPEVKARIQENLREQIREFELKKLYPGMSDEDERALRIGREIMRREAEEAAEAKAAELEDKDFGAAEEASITGMALEGPKRKERRKRRKRFYVGLAAEIALVCILGVTSMGGPERIVTFLKGMVGDREVVKVNSGGDNLVIVEENEEEAYELIEKELGVKPVRIMADESLWFENMELDKVLQLAELTYTYNEEKVVYYISAAFNDSSWGVDIEDKIINQYQIEKKDCVINVKTYAISESKTQRCSASFRYKGIEYFLLGTLKQDEFQNILGNLYFY